MNRIYQDPTYEEIYARQQRRFMSAMLALIAIVNSANSGGPIAGIVMAIVILFVFTITAFMQ